MLSNSNNNNNSNNSNQNILINDFIKLSNEEISKLYINKKGDNSTMVFAYDGTRRSYLVSHGFNNLNSIGQSNTSNSANDLFNNNNKIQDNNNICKNKEIKIDYIEYSKTAIHKFLDASVMMFQHGVKTIVYPMWFSTLEKRGPEYLPKFIQYLWGLSALVDQNNYHFLKLFQENGVRVVFYGEYKKLLERVNDVELLSKFEQIMEITKNNNKKLLLLGTNIEEPSQTVIKNTISYYKRFGKEPTKNELIKQYYNVKHNIEDVSFYLGFDRFSTDGRPILISDNGAEDLYYTVSPHSFLSVESFRKVIYDHLYQRSITNAKEYELKVSDIENMKQFYENNSNNIMGIGNINPYGNYWYPSPQVELPKIEQEKLQKQKSQQKLEIPIIVELSNEKDINEINDLDNTFKSFKNLNITHNNTHVVPISECKHMSVIIGNDNENGTCTNQFNNSTSSSSTKSNSSMGGSPPSPRYLGLGGYL